MKDKINSHNTSDNWHSVYADIANLVGEDNTIKIYRYFRGMNINFPMKLFTKTGLENIIKNEYNGSIVKDLARKYGYSMRHINRIVIDNKLRNKKENKGE